MHNGLKEDGSIRGGCLYLSVHTTLGPKQQTPAASTGCVEYYVIVWRYLHPPHTEGHFSCTSAVLKSKTAILLRKIFRVGGSLSLCSFEAVRSVDVSPVFFRVRFVCNFIPVLPKVLGAPRTLPLTKVAFLSL